MITLIGLYLIIGFIFQLWVGTKEKLDATQRTVIALCWISFIIPVLVYYSKKRGKDGVEIAN